MYDTSRADVVAWLLLVGHTTPWCLLRPPTTFHHRLDAVDLAQTNKRTGDRKRCEEGKTEGGTHTHTHPPRSFSHQALTRSRQRLNTLHLPSYLPVSRGGKQHPKGPKERNDSFSPLYISAPRTRKKTQSHQPNGIFPPLPPTLLPS